MKPTLEIHLEVISTRMFEAAAKKLLSEEDRRQLELMLVADPSRGPVIEGTGGFRKLRFARVSRREGKSGGTRVIYYLVQRKDRIYLVDIYAKGVREDLTRAERNGLCAMSRLLDEEK